MATDSGHPAKVWLRNWESVLERAGEGASPADDAARVEEEATGALIEGTASLAPAPERLPPSLPTEALAQVSSTVLRSSVERLAGRLAEEGEGVDLGPVLETLGSLASLVEAVRTAPDSADIPRREGKQAVLAASLCGLLRSEVLRQWMELPRMSEASEILDNLCALEAVRLGLEVDRDRDFVARLAEPGGLELLVEVAHDIRSPLTSILFLSEALRGGHSGEVNEVQRRQLGLIYSAALGLISIAGDVMELAKGGTRLSEEAPVPFSVAEVLGSVREMVQPMADEKGIMLRIVPPEQDQYLGHPVPLSRVLLNLTTNALKFTDQGFVEVDVRNVSRSVVCFSVRDTGRGMDPGDLERLFQPFRKADHRDGYLFSGTGLGLSIARRLVEAMGSRLEFETRKNRGTRFFFDLQLPSPGGP